MKIEPTTQPKGEPKDKPILKDPVKVTLDVPVFYWNGKTPQKASPTITCDRAHAELVYRVLNDWAVKHHFGLVHIGTYYPRKARTAGGKTILFRGHPRWSGHSWGAIDFEGIVTSDGQHLNINDVESGAPAKYQELMENLTRSISAAHRNREIVKEPHWRHIGLVPVGGW